MSPHSSAAIDKWRSLCCQELNKESIANTDDRAPARPTAAAVKRALKAHIDPEKAAFYPKFFKTGKGQYGEGDKFLGVTVPHQRKVAKQFRHLADAEIRKLLDDKLHECRLTALLVMVEQFRRADAPRQEQIVALYFEKMDRINNWDLVDASAHKILGPYFIDRNRARLRRLSKSKQLWRQRIAVLTTLHFIKEKDFDDTLSFAEAMLDHPHDLIHKAVGWMLREIGKQHEPTLKAFLNQHAGNMPRTMLRYAIERLPEPQRKSTSTSEAACQHADLTIPVLVIEALLGRDHRQHFDDAFLFGLFAFGFVDIVAVFALLARRQGIKPGLRFFLGAQRCG